MMVGWAFVIEWMGLLAREGFGCGTVWFRWVLRRGLLPWTDIRLRFDGFWRYSSGCLDYG